MSTNLTNHFHPLDLSVNSHLKTFLKEKLQQLRASKVQKQLDDGENVYEVNIVTNLARMKPIYARWIISLHDEFRNSNEMITEASHMASIIEVFTCESKENEDAFRFLKTLLFEDMENMFPIKIWKICRN